MMHISTVAEAFLSQTDLVEVERVYGVERIEDVNIVADVLAHGYAQPVTDALVGADKVTARSERFVICVCVSVSE